MLSPADGLPGELSMIRIASLLAATILLAGLLLPLPAERAGRWLDLTPGEGLKGWRRVPIAPDVKLAAKNPWSMDAAGKVLLCDGVGVKEMLLQEREFEDGTFHVEWRFRKVPDKHDYNGGVYVRTSLDGKVWHQSQVAHLEKRPLLGDLFGETLLAGKPHHFEVNGRGAQLAKPPGEWNAYDITCKGPVITVAVNGQPATKWEACEVPLGHVGMQAEFFFIEFKNLRFRPTE
jgi:hypothetical protein